MGNPETQSVTRRTRTLEDTHDKVIRLDERLLAIVAANDAAHSAIRAELVTHKQELHAIRMQMADRDAHFLKKIGEVEERISRQVATLRHEQIKNKATLVGAYIALSTGGGIVAFVLSISFKAIFP